MFAGAGLRRFVGVLLAVGSAVSVVAIALVVLLVQLFTSDKIAMSTMGRQGGHAGAGAELHGIVERLCVQVDLPKPGSAYEDAMPNASAMGRSKKSTTVCATRGSSTCSSPPSSKA